MRAIIRYAREGAASYISHLDMQRAFARALRRAELPVKYSEGYNPHILMSFASPLSVGLATRGDYLEVRMEEERPGKDIREALCRVLPQGLCVTYAGALAETCPKLMSVSHSASYELVFDRVLPAPEDFLAGGACMAQDRKGRTVDLRPLVYELERDGNTLRARLANSSAGALNPMVLAGALGCGPARITRTECYCRFEGTVMPYRELGR